MARVGNTGEIRAYAYLEENPSNSAILTRVIPFGKSVTFSVTLHTALQTSGIILQKKGSPGGGFLSKITSEVDGILFLSYRSAPVGATAFDIWGTAGVNLYIVHNGETLKIPSCVPRWPLETNIEAIITMDTPSIKVNSDKVGRTAGGRGRGLGRW